MRIAVTGSHRTGKSTLVARLADLFPGHVVVEEPYWLMEEEGHDFCHPPSVEDFVAQLERSIDELSGAGEDVLLDRCPVDFLAYLAVHEDNDRFDLEEWLPRVRLALQRLDLVIFVRIETPDRLASAPSDDGGPARKAVDVKLAELLLDDPYDLGLAFAEVRGDTDARAAAVLRWLRRDSKVSDR